MVRLFIHSIFLSISLVGFSHPLFGTTRTLSGAQSSSLTRLGKQIESILPPPKNLEAGIVIQSLDRGDTLYERAADRLLIPASVSKLFTAYVALKKMKPTATFKTTLHVVGSVREGRLTGDLYIKGGGDPSFVSERLWMLVNDFTRLGVRVITGNLVGDSSYFDQEKTPEVRPKYLKDQAYNAPLGALSFNFNTTTIYLRPGDSPGASPIVYTDPENSYIDLVNQATTGKPDSKNTIVVTRTDFVKGDIGDTILLRGSLPRDHREIRFYRNIVNPALYATHMFKTFLEQRGVKVQGNVVEGQVPSGAIKWIEFESLPLWQVVWGMNKFSNNFVADQILKRVGAEVWGPPGTLQKGLSAMEEALEDIGIAKKSYEIHDGSGLNRNTHVSTRQIVTVLKKAFRDFSIVAEFIASLGIAGEDGTLRNRLPSTHGVGALRAKTGSLDGVASLAGYLSTADGEMLAFAIVLNDTRMKYGKMTGWIDQIASQLMRFSRK